jgi:hypothetical protein
MSPANDGQLTADEARQLGREQCRKRIMLNRVYAAIRRASVAGRNTLDIEGLDGEISKFLTDELQKQGFHVLTLPPDISIEARRRPITIIKWL